MFIEVILNEIKKKEMSASKLCKLAGITRSTFSAMKNRGSEPKPLTKRAICEVLNLDSETLEPIEKTAYDDLKFIRCLHEWDQIKDFMIKYENELKRIPRK